MAAEDTPDVIDPLVHEVYTQGTPPGKRISLSYCQATKSGKESRKCILRCIVTVDVEATKRGFMQN
jgi:hypothetical protein